MTNKFPETTAPGSNGFTDKFYQAVKGEIVLYIGFQKIEAEEIVWTPSVRPSIPEYNLSKALEQRRDPAPSK